MIARRDDALRVHGLIFNPFAAGMLILTLTGHSLGSKRSGASRSAGEVGASAAGQSSGAGGLWR